MSLEAGLNSFLSQLSGLQAYWFERPSNQGNAIVFTAISMGEIPGNLAPTGINSDLYSISVYHYSPDDGKQIADAIKAELSGFSGDLGGYAVQQIEFSGGRDLPQKDEAGQRQYLFVRDFVINH